MTAIFVSFAVAFAVNAVFFAVAAARKTDVVTDLSYSLTFVLLAAALAIGPLNVLRRKPNPVSTDVRRDIGIWAAGFGIAHTIAGLNVHMRGHMIRYFVYGTGAIDTGTRVFIAANWIGLIAVLLLVAFSFARLRWPGHFNGAPNGIWVMAPAQYEADFEKYLNTVNSQMQAEFKALEAA